MQTFVTVIHVLTCIFLILLVLIQAGRGSDITATLGGSSNTVFGSSGGAEFLQKATSTLAAIFFVTSLGLTIYQSRQNRSLFENTAIPTAPAPAASAAAPATPEKK
jgi:preprotein translocase subunit SecG